MLQAFKGVDVQGIGFALEPEEAQQLIEKDDRNRDVIFPFLNAENLNTNPDQFPSRWIINFFDWSLEQAENYSDCMQIVLDRVKPYRETHSEKNSRQFWWRYGRSRPALYSAIEHLDRVLVIAQISRTAAFIFVPKGWVYSQRVFVFAIQDAGKFTVLQSVMHNEWAWRYSSTMKSDLSYVSSDAFETFPFPADTSSLETIGEQYHEHRRQVMLTRQEGLTKTYNRFHDPEEPADDIALLRRLHTEMDAAVAAAYGWHDLDLGHGFHETKQGTRYTISEAARREVLDRLLALNHERYAEEVAAGLHEKGKAKKGSGTRKKKSGGGGQADQEKLL
jgi:hypothetical protein